MAFFLDSFNYTDVSDFVANGNWNPSASGTISSTTAGSGTLDLNFVSGDNGQLTCFRALDGVFAEESSLVPGIAIAYFDFDFTQPLPSSGGVFSLALFNSTLTGGFGCDFICAEGSPDTFLASASTTYGTDSTFNNPVAATGTSGLLVLQMNTSTRKLSILVSVGSGSYAKEFDDPLPTDEALSYLYWTIAASPIAGPSNYTASADEILCTYGEGGGGGRTYYTPNLTGAKVSNTQQFSARSR
jgi:hypothetical protein